VTPAKQPQSAIPSEPHPASEELIAYIKAESLNNKDAKKKEEK
jgi:hypothetical protein